MAVPSPQKLDHVKYEFSHCIRNEAKETCHAIKVATVDGLTGSKPPWAKERRLTA